MFADRAGHLYGIFAPVVSIRIAFTIDFLYGNFSHSAVLMERNGGGKHVKRFGGLDWAALALGTIASRDASADDLVATRCRSAGPHKSHKR